MPFTYEDSVVRTVLIDGEPWFALADLCKVLDLTNTRNVSARLADDQKGVHAMDTLGGRQNVTIVNESGMYEVVIRSDKPEAINFRRWLTGTVLPEIRKTGSFVAVQSPEQQMALGLVAAQKMLAAKDERIAELTPPARSWQLLAEAAGDFSVAEAAKILSRDPEIKTGRDRLFDYLAEAGWIFRSKNSRGGWEAYQTQVNLGRLVEKPARPFLNSKTGSYELPAPTIRVTAKGIGRLHELLGGTGEIQMVTGVTA